MSEKLLDKLGFIFFKETNLKTEFGVFGLDDAQLVKRGPEML